MRLHDLNIHTQFEAEIKMLEGSIKNYRKGLLFPSELILHIISQGTEMQRLMCKDFALLEQKEASKPKVCECEHPDGIPTSWNKCPMCGLELNRGARVTESHT